MLRRAHRPARTPLDRGQAGRFVGMSDDDPENVDLIIKAMCDCKKKYLDKRFFVINMHECEQVKLEVFPVDYPVTRKADTDESIG